MVGQGAMDTRSPIRAPSGAALEGGLPRHVFHVLRETPCPYLPGRRERKLMARIEGADATEFYSLLSQSGFRRSHVFAYRPACSGCRACVPVRVRAGEFRASRGQRRLIRRNGDLVAAEQPARATREHYELFVRYITERHGEGEMSEMRFADYESMVEDTALDSRLAEYRLSDGRLAAVCLTDWLTDGASAVYSFFNPDLARRSLGSWMILSLIAAAAERDLPYVYLGYWVENAPKMSYKTRFRPLEGLGPEGWRLLAE